MISQRLSTTKNSDYLENPDKQTKIKKHLKEIAERVYKPDECASGHILNIRGIFQSVFYQIVA